MLGTSKSIFGFVPTSVPGCTLWLDGADNNSMNSASAVTVWNDKSGNSNNVTGSGTWSGSNMVFNGSTNAFSNTGYVFPNTAYSLFAVYSNTTAPTASAYMNAVYGNGGFPMLGTFGSNRDVTARSVVANTGALVANVGWAARIAGVGATDDFGYGIATDSSGNVVVTGYYSAALTVYNQGSSGTGFVTLPLISGIDCFVAKYNSAGAVQWAARIAGTTGNDVGRGIATDSLGNVVITGSNTSALTVYNQGASGTGVVTLPNAGGTNCFVAKYLSDGTVSWAARIVGGGSGNSIATDPSGNVIVVGNYAFAVTVYNQGSNGTAFVTLPFAGNDDCFIAKYNSIGDVQWAARIAGTGFDSGNGIATDPSGNVVVAGSYGAAVTVYNQGSNGTAFVTLPFAGIADCFVAKYSSAGAVVWAARISGTGSDSGLAVVTDPSGNVVVAGSYGAAVTVYNQGASGTGFVTLPFTGASSDCFVAKYLSDGTVSWAARISGSSQDQGLGIATDTSGNVLVTGSYAAALTVYNQGASGTGVVTLPFVGGTDCFVAKYSSAGDVQWAARIAGTTTSSDIGYGIATDLSGNVLVSGVYSGALTVYNQGAGGAAGTTLPIIGGRDAFLAKYNKDGYITAPIPANSNVLVDATYLPSTMSPFVNGTTQTTRAGTTLAATGVFVGGPSNYFNGTISEVLVYNNTLTATQRQAVEGYLAYKWRIQSNLPTTQLYYSRPPFNRVFTPTDIATCSVWMDGGDNSTMNSTTAVTTWNDKSGNARHMTGSGTWSGSNMVFNGSTNAFSNTGYVFPHTAYSLFAVYSNTVAPAAAAYMNVMYGSNGYPMLGTFGVNRDVSARSVVANTGALGATVGWAAETRGSRIFGQGIAADALGNVFVIGGYTGTVTLCNATSIGGIGATLADSFTDAWIAKYSSVGAVVWAARITSTGTEDGLAIAVDPSGNVLVTGFYGGAVTLRNADGTSGATLTLAGIQDVYIAKYSSAGAVVWAARIASTGNDIGKGITTDLSGNVFVTGQMGGQVTLYNATSQGGAGVVTLAFTGGSDGFIAKYTSAGLVEWGARFAATTTSEDWGNAVATNASGDVFIAGVYNTGILTIYTGSSQGGGSAVTLPASGGLSDGFIAKYLSNGTFSWAARFAGTLDDRAYGVATNASGDVFVVGSYTSSSFIIYNATSLGGLSAVTLTLLGTQTGFIAKYSSTGAVVWAARIGSDFAEVRGVAIDPSGNVLITGTYGAAATIYKANTLGGGSGASLPSTFGSDSFTAKYTSDGDVVWATRASGIATAGYENGNAVAVDPSGNVLAVGYYANSAITFYNRNGTTAVTLPFAGVYDTYVVKYNKDGYITNAPTPANSNVLVDATYLPSTMSPFINGTAATTLAGTTLATTGLFIGGPTNYFNGTLSELIIYASTLTSGQRQAVEGYLAAKWGLRPSLISTQPYKILPPATSV